MKVIYKITTEIGGRIDLEQAIKIAESLLERAERYTRNEGVSVHLPPTYSVEVSK